MFCLAVVLVFWSSFLNAFIINEVESVFGEVVSSFSLDQPALLTRSTKVAAYYNASIALSDTITKILIQDGELEYARTWNTKASGYILGSLDKILALYDIADNPLISTVCETGFNVGHGVLLFLLANPNASIVSFDIFQNRYSPYAVRALHLMFPSRKITVIAGDSSVSVPNFFNGVGKNTVCDLIFVDSGTSAVRSLDIVNLMPFANRVPRQRVAPNIRIAHNRSSCMVQHRDIYFSDMNAILTLDSDHLAYSSADSNILEYISSDSFTNMLIVDDLHMAELRMNFDYYVATGQIKKYYEFPVLSMSSIEYFCVDWEDDPSSPCIYMFCNYSKPGVYYDESVFVAASYL